MKKLLILIVGIAIYLHFYPQPELNTWLYQQKEKYLDDYMDVFDTKAQIHVGEIWQDLQPKTHSFTPKEKRLAREITTSKSKTKSFYRDFCKARKREFIFQENNQKRLCLTIHKYADTL